MSESAESEAEGTASDVGAPTSTESPSATTTDIPTDQGVAIVTPEGDLSPLDNLIFVGSWSNARAPAACVEGLSNPIEGCDPAVDDTWGLDCDADGIADHVAYACNPADTVRGPAFTGP